MNFKQEDYAVADTKELANEIIKHDLESVEEPSINNEPKVEAINEVSSNKEDVSKKEEKISSLKEKIKALFGLDNNSLIKKGEEKINAKEAYRNELKNIEENNPENVDKYKLAHGKYDYVIKTADGKDYIDAGGSRDINI